MESSFYTARSNPPDIMAITGTSNIVTLNQIYSLKREMRFAKRANNLLTIYIKFDKLLNNHRQYIDR
jgi:hypothetical protein